MVTFHAAVLPYKKACPCPLRGTIREVVHVDGIAPTVESAITLYKQLGNYIESGHLSLAGRLEEPIKLRADNIPQVFAQNISF